MLKRITIRKLQGDRGDVVPFPETFTQFQQLAAETCGYTSSRIPFLHFSIHGGEVRSHNYHLVRDRDIIDVEFEHPKANTLSLSLSQSNPPSKTTSSQSKRTSSSQSNGISTSKKRKSMQEPEEEPEPDPDLEEDGDGDDQDYVEGKRPPRRASSRARKKIHAVAASQNYVEVDEDDDAPLVEEKEKKKTKRHALAKRLSSSASNPNPNPNPSPDPDARTSSSSYAFAESSPPSGPPVKNKSAYWFFSQQFAKELANQGDSHTTISQQAGTMWKELAPEEKQKFLTMAIEDKVRYETEQAAWEARNTSETTTAPTNTTAAATIAATTTTTATAATTASATQSPPPPPEEAKKICTTLGCDKVALLGPCPNCAALGLPPAYFCSQTCFETGWQQHALKHVAPTPVQ